MTMNNEGITIKELCEKKRNLETQIAQLLTDFEESTGLEIDSVEYDEKYITLTYSTKCKISIKIEL